MVLRSRTVPVPILLTLGLLAALPLGALVEPLKSPVRAKEMRHPDLWIGNSYLRAAEAAIPARLGDLERLGVAPRAAFLDARTGRWGALLSATPLVPGSANSLRPLPEKEVAAETDRSAQAWVAFVAYLSAHRPELGIDVAELRSPGRITVHDGGDLIQIHAPRQVGGVPVRDSYLTAVLNHGNLVLFGARNWADLTASSAPALGRDEARRRLRTFLGADLPWSPRGKAGLEWIPMAVGRDLSAGAGLTYRLAWVLRPGFDPEVDRGSWEALIDARTGEVLAFEDTNRYASTRVVEGGVLPLANDGVAPDGQEQAGWPMPFTDLATADGSWITDGGGNLLACVDGSAATTLSGRYLSMTDSCGSIHASGAGSALDLGTGGGTNCATPGSGGAGNTHSSRSGYYEMNRIKEMARGHLPDNSWLQGKLIANMNLNSFCNAFWGGSTVNFYRYGAGCANTGELAGVFDHEWGHGMDDNDANAFVSNPGEGIADIYASLRLNTSCIGRSFRLGALCSGYGDPCTSCDGVRDIDWAERASGQPHDVHWIFSHCGSGGFAPCGGAVHCEGAVPSEAVWDLWNRDLPALFGMSLDTAREVASRLTYLGAGPVGGWYQCSTPYGGCNADGGYLNYLAADDDNGNLTDGTPHMSAIFAAFDRHQIACNAPVVQDSGCGGAPTAAPAVSATPEDRGAALSWGAVAGASSYRIYRTEGVHGCDFGKVLVAETHLTSYIDAGLKNGFEASYIVVPMGPAASCLGPASSCTAVTPAGGVRVAADRSTVALEFLSSDGDPFIDNCERIRVSFDVANVGTGTATGVEIFRVNSPSHPAIDPSITFSAPVSPSLGECASALGSFTFDSMDLTNGDTLLFDVCFKIGGGDPLCEEISLANTELDVLPLASRTFTFESDFEDWQVAEGTFNRTTLGGGAEGTTWYAASSSNSPNQCDNIRSPVLRLTPTSTLSLWNQFDIEPFFAGDGSWYDRANVGLYETDSGQRTPVDPDGGRLYNASGSNGSCGTAGQNGWADSMTSWAKSTWSAAALGSAAVAGDLVQVDVRYGTDPGLEGFGFRFDQVTVTDVEMVLPDARADVCPEGPTGPIFADGFESGKVSAWTRCLPCP